MTLQSRICGSPRSACDVASAQQAQTDDVLQQNRPASEGMVAEAPGEQHRCRGEQRASDERAGAQISAVDERDRTLVPYRRIDRAEVERDHRQEYEDGQERGVSPKATRLGNHRRGDGHRQPYSRGPDVTGRDFHQPREYREQQPPCPSRSARTRPCRVGLDRRKAPLAQSRGGRRSPGGRVEAFSRWQVHRPLSSRPRATR